MKPFDFAEAKMVERNFYKRYVFVRVRRIIALFVLTALVSISSVGMRTVYAKRAEGAKTKLARIDSLCKSAKVELAEVNKNGIENEWRAELDKSSRDVLGITNAILRSAPDDVWISGVHSLEKSPDVIVEGCASTFASLSRLTGSLRENPSFATVQLDSTRQVNSNSAEPVGFTLHLKTKGSESPAPDDPRAPVPAGVPAVERSY